MVVVILHCSEEAAQSLYVFCIGAVLFPSMFHWRPEKAVQSPQIRQTGCWAGDRPQPGCGWSAMVYIGHVACGCSKCGQWEAEAVCEIVSNLAEFEFQ